MRITRQKFFDFSERSKTIDEKLLSFKNRYVTRVSIRWGVHTATRNTTPEVKLERFLSSLGKNEKKMLPPPNPIGGVGCNNQFPFHHHNRRNNNSFRGRNRNFNGKRGGGRATTRLGEKSSNRIQIPRGNRTTAINRRIRIQTQTLLLPFRRRLLERKSLLVVALGAGGKKNFPVGPPRRPPGPRKPWKGVQIRSPKR